MLQTPPTKLILGSRELTRVKWAKVWLSIATTDLVVSGRGLFGKAKKEWRYGPEHLGVRWDFLLVIDDASGFEGANDEELDLEFDVELDGITFPASLEDVAGIKLIEGEAPKSCAGEGRRRAHRSCSKDQRSLRASKWR